MDGIVLGVHKQKDEAITTQLIAFATPPRRSYVCKPWHNTGDDCGGSSGESIWQEGNVCKGGDRPPIDIDGGIKCASFVKLLSSTAGWLVVSS